MAKYIKLYDKKGMLLGVTEYTSDFATAAGDANVLVFDENMLPVGGGGGVNPPSPSVPSLNVELPAEIGTEHVEFNISDLPGEPTSIDATFSYGTAQSATIELIGKQSGVDLIANVVTLETAVAYEDGVATFTLVENHQLSTLNRLIVVAGGQTFTFE